MQHAQQQGSQPSRLAVIKNLALAELEKQGIPEESIVSLAFTGAYKDEGGTIRSFTIDVATGCSMEEVPNSNNAGHSAAGTACDPLTTSAPAAEAGPPAAEAAAAAAAAAAELIGLESQPTTTSQFFATDAADATAAASAAVAEAASHSLPTSLQDIQLASSRMQAESPCKLSVYNRSSPKRLTSDGRIYKRRGCAPSSSNSVSNKKKPLQLFICTPEMQAAGEKQVYLCMTDSKGPQRLQQGLLKATCWADVQRCVTPFVSAERLQSLAALACHQV